jgi:hypothetical protein
MPSIADISLTIAIILLATLYLRESFLRRRLVKQESQQLDKAHISAQQIIDDAVKKSQELIYQAETASIKIVSESKAELNQGQTLYSTELKHILQQFEAGIANEMHSVHERVASSQTIQEKFLADLSTKFSQFQKSTEETLSKDAAKATEGFGEQLTESLRQISDQASTAVEKDLQKEHENVKRFEESQIKLIQENLAAILERTLELVLTKKLTLGDHIDLVNESFEEAKKEKFLP